MSPSAVPELSDLLADRSTALARELARAGADFVVVGSTASRLRGARVRPRDLDVCVLPDDLVRFAAAAVDVTATVGAVTLQPVGVTSLGTGWCALDVFAVAVLPPSSPVDLAGVRLAVADV